MVEITLAEDNWGCLGDVLSLLLLTMIMMRMMVINMRRMEVLV